MEDNRESLYQLIETFFRKDIHRVDTDRNLEDMILQVVERKSAVNFQLFLKQLDLMIDNKNDNEQYLFEDSLRFSNENQIETIRMARNLYQYLRSEIIKNNDERNAYINHTDFDPYKNLVFDIFLSHRYQNKFYNLIVYYILTKYYNMSIYVDWIFDSEINRKALNTNTIHLLTRRMDQSKNLLFFNLIKTQTTNWMAWEIGYFKAKIGKIGILDLDNYYKSQRTNIEILSSNCIFTVNRNDIMNNNSIVIDKW